jgi:hypothetical protein
VTEGAGITLRVAGGSLDLDVEALRGADGIAARDPGTYVARLLALGSAAPHRKEAT